MQIIEIEVAYAEPDRAVVKSYRLTVPATIRDALRLAAEDPGFAGIPVEGVPVGVFGSVASPDRPLCDGDRVEIYRPLAADPKAARRQRARQRANKSGRS